MHHIRQGLKNLVKRAIGRAPYASRFAQVYETARAIEPTHILEIGTYDGFNAVRMVEAAGSPIDSRRYYGFDLFEHQTAEAFESEFSKRPPTRDQVASFLKRKGLADPLLVAGDSTVTLPEYVPDLPTMDLILIDGGHSQETVAQDWRNVQPLIGPDTVIFFDDYPQWGVGPVVDGIDQSAWHVEILPVTDTFRAAEGFGGDADRLSFQLARVQASEGGRGNHT